MTKKQWKAQITKQCKGLGTYRKEFDMAISALAEVLEQRDKTKTEWEEQGGTSVIETTNKAGFTNLVKNPLLVLWDDLGKTALSYYRELGLTPHGLKKLNEEAMKAQKSSPLAEALKGLDT